MGGYRSWPSSRQATFWGGGHRWSPSSGPLGQEGLHPPPQWKQLKSVGCWVPGYGRLWKTDS